MKRFSNLKILAILFLCVFGATSMAAESAILFFNTSSGQVHEGEVFGVDVKIKSPLQSINAVSGAVTFPGSLINVVSISKDKSIINLWTQEPSVQRNKILFEGVVLNPGFQGSSGLVFHITFEAKHTGVMLLGFSEGAVLANDGRGTNILATLNPATFNIIPGITPAPGIDTNTNTNTNTNTIAPPVEINKPVALPVITDYSPSVESKNGFYLKGKGEPDALTKIVFKDISVKSVGEQFIGLLQNNKKKLDETTIKNDATGAFEYMSPKDIVAGVFNATPFLVDDSANVEKPGLGVQLFVSDSQIIKALIVLLNALALLIPIVGLVVLIYFIPWYSWRQMRVLKKKLGLEEEKIVLTGEQLERQDKILNQSVNELPRPPIST